MATCRLFGPMGGGIACCAGDSPTPGHTSQIVNLEEENESLSWATRQLGGRVTVRALRHWLWQN
jgi:hypothetical protein